MSAPEYSLPDTLERIYENQLALEAALMELTLIVEGQGNAEGWQQRAWRAGDDWRERRAHQAGLGAHQTEWKDVALSNIAPG